MYRIQNAGPILFTFPAEKFHAPEANMPEITMKMKIVCLGAKSKINIS
jgi:hypothetical protein